MRGTIEQQVEKNGNLLGRLMTEHILRNVELISRVQGGDIISGIVFLAILSANVRHVTENVELAAIYGPLDKTIPDEMRIPISIHAVSESLGMPYETTRRYVTKLIKTGQCIRIGRGVVVPNSALDTLRQSGLIEQGLLNLRRLVIASRRNGLDIGKMGQT